MSSKCNVCNGSKIRVGSFERCSDCYRIFVYEGPKIGYGVSDLYEYSLMCCPSCEESLVDHFWELGICPTCGKIYKFNPKDGVLNVIGGCDTTISNR
jgi:hypothetical protein